MSKRSDEDLLATARWWLAILREADRMAATLQPEVRKRIESASNPHAEMERIIGFLAFTSTDTRREVQDVLEFLVNAVREHVVHTGDRPLLAAVPPPTRPQPKAWSVKTVARRLL